jgi:hypothetical protein
VYGILTALLPFLILVVFWHFVMRRSAGRMTSPMVDKLEEIRQELVQIREELRRQNF